MKYRKPLILLTLLATASLCGLSQQAVPTPGTNYEVDVVSLLPTGFVPAQISPSAGSFFLVIRIYDHTADMLFDVAAADQGILPTSLSRLRSRWSGFISLAAGDHVLKDHLNPQRQLTIHIGQ